MGTPADRSVDETKAPVTEKDYYQRPEDQSEQRRSFKIWLIVAIVAIGLLAVPVLVVLYSGLINIPVEEAAPRQNVIEEQPAADPEPTDEDVPSERPLPAQE